MGEKKYKYLVGIDEVGRGALCGPVVASCVFFQKHPHFPLKDSKQLSARRREFLFQEIRQISTYSFGFVDQTRIDKMNIFWATQLAFLRAMERFLKKSGFEKKDVLFIVDGPYFKYTGYNVRCVIGADKKIKVVSAASIMAKVLRDRVMTSYDAIFRGWNFSKHKGYPTKEHKLLLQTHGASPIHRFSFNLGI